MTDLPRALAAMDTAVDEYRRCCREYRQRSRAWNVRYADRPVVARSRIANDPVLWEIAADIAMYRADAALWAAVVAALRVEQPVGVGV